MISSITVTQLPGREIIADGGRVALSGAARIVGGRLRAANGGEFLVTGMLTEASLSDLELLGPLSLSAGAALTVAADGMANADLIRVNTGGFGTGTELRLEPGASVQGAGTIELLSAEDSLIVAESGGTSSLGPEQRVTGVGTLAGEGELALDGVICPGDSIGSMMLRGTVRLGPTATLEAQLLSPTTHDSLRGNGAASLHLDGRLELLLVDGYQPRFGERMDLLQGVALSGSFDSVGGDPLPGALLWKVLADDTGLTVLASCAADYTDDGVLNTQDAIRFLSLWASRDPAADLDGDGDADSADVLRFLNLWNAGCE